MGTMWENGSDRTPDAVCHYEKQKSLSRRTGKVFIVLLKMFLYAYKKIRLRCGRGGSC